MVLVGAAALLVERIARPKQIAPAWRLPLVPALALACFSAAQALGGSGFIASFVGGLFFGALVHREKKEPLLLAAEGIGGIAALLTWVVFGATVVGKLLGNVDRSIFIYALLSLTVVRMLPVFLCLIGTGVATRDVLFMGWFGPRGLASIVFTIMALEADIPGMNTIALVAACTILMSVVGHGLTAQPLSRLLTAQEAKDEPGREEATRPKESS
jgi:NhaP-type Na+/H+ or K+/H+ antiporter